MIVETLSWCDSLYRQNISTLEIHCQLMLVFGGGVLRPHSCRKRVKRVQKWFGIHDEDGTFQPGRSHSASGGTGFGKPSRHNSWFFHCTWVICENCTQHCPCTAGIQQCVCVVVTKIHDGSSRKLICGGAPSLPQSFKGGANGFSESMVTLWDMVSPFYLKWALMQWTHPSSLTATKCEVCQYAGRLWHL